MARAPLERHTFRCTPAEWAAAMAEADRRGEYLSEALRRFVREYARSGTVSTDTARPPRTPQRPGG